MSDTEKYYLEAKEQLMKQFDIIDRLNAKTNALIIVCGMFIICLGELISRGFYFTGIGLPLIVIAMVILLFAYRVVYWQNGPNIDLILHEASNGTKAEEFFMDIIKASAEWYNQNEKMLNITTKRINWAAKLFFCGFIISLISFLFFRLV